jgi:predicted nicotinamide N-methyase
MANRAKDEIKAYGIRVLQSRHPEVRKLRRLHFPSVHGNKHWASSWLLMDYFRHLGLPKGARVMEVGCGWGLAGIYCAKQHNAIVTGVDIDPAVFPYLRLHANINKVHIATLHKRFSKLKRRHLKDIDVVIGADICFWDQMVNPLKRFIRRALRAGVRLIIIADPGRSPFEQISNYFVKQGQGEVLDWDVQRPRDIQGRLLKINLQVGKRVKSFSPHKSA